MTTIYTLHTLITHSHRDIYINIIIFITHNSLFQANIFNQTTHATVLSIIQIPFNLDGNSHNEKYNVKKKWFNECIFVVIFET